MGDSTEKAIKKSPFKESTMVLGSPARKHKSQREGKVKRINKVILRRKTAC